MTTRGSHRLEPDRNTTSEVRERELRALALNAEAEYLTTGMFERVLFPSRRRAQRRIRVLLDHGLVRAHLQGEALHREQVYTVTTRGFERLHEEGLLPAIPKYPVRLPRPQRLAHALLSRAVFIECVAAVEENVIERVEVRFDDELASLPIYQAARLVPDALLFLTRGTVTMRVGVEVDRGTETTTTLREKFRRWKALLGAAEEVGAVLPTLILAVVEGDRRRATVERLAGEVLPATSIRIVRLSEMEALLDSGWPHGGAAGGHRAGAPQATVFRPVAEAPTTMFRALTAPTRREP